jgi:hypothetical protein
MGHAAVSTRHVEPQAVWVSPAAMSLRLVRRVKQDSIARNAILRQVNNGYFPRMDLEWKEGELCP